MVLDKNYWENKYSSKELGWDAGQITTPLKTYIDQLKDKHIKILVPGAGRGHEVMYLVQQGFTHVFVVDIAQEPLNHIKTQLPNFPKDRLIESDFFTIDLRGFDLILEQTFFCALAPKMRLDYVVQMNLLLKKGGKLVGLLFNFPLTSDGPPFGGNKDMYDQLFTSHFSIKTLQPAYNSIKPRAGKELFFIFEK